MKYPTFLYSFCLSALLLLVLHTAYAHAAAQSAAGVVHLQQTPPVDSTDTPASPVVEPTAEPSGKPPFTGGQPVQQPLIFTDQETVRNRTAPNAETGTDAAPVLTIWYGLNQTFGQIGTPVPWVNILGNVAGDVRVKSLVYSLNGGAPVSLGMGPDKRRLAEPGDFNVELDINDLNDGPNQVVITATDRFNEQSSVTVTVNYTSGNRWPLPYTADWSSAGTISEVAQIVDGQWAKQADGTIHPTWLDYDRLVAIGDITWTDYEVIAPVTIHAIDGDGFPYPSSGPGVGLLLRWPGHYQENDEQPYTGWKRLGALGWFRWSMDNTGTIMAGLQMIGYNNSELAVNPSVLPEFETPYLMKMQVESSETPGAGAYYRYKVWKAADPEPAGWQMEGQNNPAGAAAGTLLLVAHHVDASFGNVTIRPLNEEQRVTLQTNVIGSGSIGVEPQQADYAPGQQVTLTPQAATGWQFAGWSGGLQGTANPAMLTLNEDTTVTATFTQLSYPLTTAVQGQGSVGIDPVLPSYPHSTVVTLTAAPESGWNFVEWTGDHTGNENPVQITMTGPKAITALFSETPPVLYQLTTTVSGEGMISRNPANADGRYRAGTAVTLTAQAAAGWQFTGWSGALQGTGNPATLVMDGDRAVTATFTRLEHPVKVVILGNGNVARSTDLPLYPHGTALTLTATAGSGWRFVGWQGDLAGSTVEQTLVIDSAKSITATFVEEQVTNHILLATGGNGGNVTVDPILESYPEGTTVTVTAVPTPGWRFVGWIGDVGGSANPLVLTMREDLAVQAQFVQDLARFTTAVEGGGQIAGTLPTGTHPIGTVITLTANPAPDSQFLGWAGALSGNHPEATLVLDRDKHVIARFGPITHTLTVQVNGNGTVTPTTGVYQHNETVQLTATADPGSVFTG